VVSFSDLGIGPAIVQVLERQGIVEPFEVQTETIPDSLLGRDVCCRAPTGSGKTLAFGLPLIIRSKRAQSKRPTSLILTPTRELAEQINSVLRPIAAAADRDVVSIYGGVSYKNQYNALNRGVDILVACPGRLLDLLDRRALRLDDVETVVLDEADRMADMGFMEPVCKILDKCSKQRQTILFSATLDDDVADLVKNYQQDPVTIEVGPKEVSIENMQHLFWNMKPHQKFGVTGEVIAKCGKTMIFCKTRRGVDKLGDEMYDADLRVSTLHGGLNQRQRDRALKRFTKGGSIALVATDVAARGIDIQGVNCVVHYDPPENSKAYKHRSGRTARAGAEGVVISYVQRSQQRLYNKIQNQVGIKRRFQPPNVDNLTEYPMEYVEEVFEEERKPQNNNKRRKNKRQRGPPQKSRSSSERQRKKGHKSFNKKDDSSDDSKPRYKKRGNRGGRNNNSKKPNKGNRDSASGGKRN
jgi:superfamily II DNA/RNA helicase|tara:strand:+ start:5532 stop:6938 length:1407 start_codon:yes stop_codon:yes gene_type:complete